MSINGKDISDCIQFLKNVYVESATVLRTTEDLLSKNRWIIPTSSSVVHRNTSNSIEHPEYWMPRYIYRYFSKRKTSITEVLGITIAYDWDFNEVNFNEPMVCCSRIKFKEEVKDCKAAWFVLGGFRKYCKEITYHSANLYIDSVISDKSVGYDSLIENGNASGFYIPLVDINNSQAVENYIVKPLIKLSEEQYEECNNMIKDKAIKMIG
ncbi:hypothetical protein [Natranaerobius trueperi]|uniref:Uncharacterized protein n=1 Tax=Natranaerobius trueperi TaxID=759412 RepID=A0A226BZ87_9FIRM|nr:hypothetical protein [Natranaerobius trueperi]OWZ84102.1 hypothetical protein CDO51_05145 [Natranaerobius trueperi]